MEAVGEHFRSPPHQLRLFCDHTLPREQSWVKCVQIYTDGSCLKNPGGAGGWCAIIIDPPDCERVLTGGERVSTCNRAELMAAIRGISATPPSSVIHLVTDSEYLAKGATSWMPRWKRHGWKFSPNSQKTIKNLDLWKQLDSLLGERRVTFETVRGHSGHFFNERCDALALQAALDAQKG